MSLTERVRGTARRVVFDRFDRWFRRSQDVYTEQDELKMSTEGERRIEMELWV